MLDATSPTGRLWEALDRALSNGEHAHPMNLPTARTNAVSHPLAPAVQAAIENHRHSINQILEVHKKVFENTTHSTLELPGQELNLAHFLCSQGFNPDEIQDEEIQADYTRVEAHARSVWATECEQLSRAQRDIQSRVVALLREQSATRPLADGEEALRLQLVQRKFTVLQALLRQQITSEIVDYMRTHWMQPVSSTSKRKRRPLPQRALEVLNKWWDEHEEEPYPTEDEKSMLASAANLTLTQVNNWMSNRRVRSRRPAKSKSAKKQRDAPDSDADASA